MDAPQVIPHEVRMRGLQLVALAAALYLGLRLATLHRFFANDTEGISALLQILGTLYSVVYAFATYVIWGQFAEVENEIVNEAGALKNLVLFSKGLKEQARDPIVRAVRAYGRGVVESEWGTLSRRGNTEKTDRLFSGIISSVIDAKADDEPEQRVHERLLEIANEASAHRDQRLAVSRKRIPRTLLLFVTLTAYAILFLLLLYPFRNLGLGMVSIAIASMLLFFAHFVLMDLDNPFEGTWNADVAPFNDLSSNCR
jgi:Protein of unknown function (DUF4239)